MSDERLLDGSGHSYPKRLRCSMKLALPPKIEFHESALKAKMAVMLRSDSSVIENRWAKLDLPESAEELGDKLSKINSTRDQTCSAAIEKHFARNTKSQLKGSNKKPNATQS